ncbi:N-acetylmuramate alpha-1-phosphate uridylyltransferase MurU [Shewanella sp. CG12_big_fil_rev_8_21_14_0_65_47_15]|uniref:N-acetylmuramate alpha-1-phosphate uridylyltransferase MurU n=1 Tax=Shewanella sp. CG12_big_fil_rev_8_21_14_0_65_47_15 TaxID=1975537 RepID=UPI000CC4FE68|nr:nucleotidyltransferase family protein [Shewanella sp. CG12_big_fil_rev_8_21_14_0_65_47_15]PIW61431.1 MAG: mannose-1-phosphate guanylyltransferase [Shewanella sp. CG12_big_fil_rev_8_21_14_0_65_47_15]
MKAMILAAGRGERLRPLTDTVPKPLVPVLGKPLIIYHIEKLAALGIVDIVINHAWLGHKLLETLGDGSAFGVNIRYSAEETALETGGGIKRALPLLCEGESDAPFLVINGDVFIDTLPPLLPLAEDALAHLWLVPNPEQHPNGDFALVDNRVHKQGDTKYTFSGMGIYHPSLFNGTPEGAFALGPLLRAQMAQGRVSGAMFKGLWCDVGTLSRLQTLESHLQNNG